MNTMEFLLDLKHQGIIITLNGDRLKLNAPKGLLTHEIKKELSTRRSEIFQILNKAEQIENDSNNEHVDKISRNNYLPLSSGQERIWLLNESNPNNKTFHIPIIWKFDGAIKPIQLQQAWDQIVTRHEILRTYYPKIADKPQAKILSTYQSRIEIIDLNNASEFGNEDLETIQKNEINQPFAINAEPACRARLYLVEPRKSIFVITFHQIIFDKSSLDTLIKELEYFYNNSPNPLPEVAIQYVDFANWQQQLIKSPYAQNLHDYWRETLEAPYHLIQLPKKADITTHQPESLDFEIDKDVFNNLRQLSKQQGTTMFILMLTAVKIVLSKYAPQKDVLVFTSASQNKERFPNLIGLFANIILLRIKFEEEHSFSNLLKKIKKNTLSAVVNQNLPLEDILNYLKWQTSLKQKNLFQIFFMYDVFNNNNLCLEGLSSELISQGDNMESFDLRFSLTEKDDRLEASLEFDAGLYDFAFINEFIEQFQLLLRQIIQNPNVTLNRLVSYKEKFTSTLVNQSDYIPASDEIELKLIELWQSCLKVKPIGITDNFFHLGGHSLLAANLFAEIKKIFNKNLPLVSLIHSPTIKEIARLIRNNDQNDSWNSLVPIQSEGGRSPLFLIHGAGGNILLYRDLANDLGLDQPVYGLQSQGLDGRGEYLTDLKEMASTYIQEIKTIQPHGPYFLGGYCLGGALAYEMAQQLKEQGEETALVAMFETFNIHSNPSTYDGTYKLIHKIQNLWFHADNIMKLPLKGKFAFFKEKGIVQYGRMAQWLKLFILKKQKGFNNGEEDLIHLFIDKINDEAYEAYIPLPYDGNVAIFRPIKDFKGMEEPSYGWKDLIPDKKRIVRYMNVNPKGMMVQPFSMELATKLRDLMDISINGSSNKK